MGNKSVVRVYTIECPTCGRSLYSLYREDRRRCRCGFAGTHLSEEQAEVIVFVDINEFGEVELRIVDQEL